MVSPGSFLLTRTEPHSLASLQLQALFPSWQLAPWLAQPGALSPTHRGHFLGQRALFIIHEHNTRGPQCSHLSWSLGQLPPFTGPQFPPLQKKKGLSLLAALLEALPKQSRVSTLPNDDAQARSTSLQGASLQGELLCGVDRTKRWQAQPSGWILVDSLDLCRS